MDEEPKKPKLIGGIFKIVDTDPTIKSAKKPQAKYNPNPPMVDPEVHSQHRKKYFTDPPRYSDPTASQAKAVPNVGKAPAAYEPPLTAKPAIDITRTKALFENHYSTIRTLYAQEKEEKGSSQLPRLNGGCYQLLRTLLDMFYKDFKNERLRNGKILTTYSYINACMCTSVTDRTLYNNLKRLEAAGFLTKSKRPWFGYPPELPDGTPRPAYMNCCLEIELKSAFIKFDGDKYTMENFQEKRLNKFADFEKTEDGKPKVRRTDSNGVKQCGRLHPIKLTKAAQESLEAEEKAKIRVETEAANPISVSLANKFKTKF
jgi:hypothetical protein